MTLQSRFMPHLLINFGTAPTAAGNVQLFFSDEAGENLIWEENAAGKTLLRRSLLQFQSPAVRN